MKTIQVEITGQTPLLMHNPEHNLTNTSQKIRKKSSEHTPEEDAKKSAYLTKTGELYIPSRAIFSTLIRASKGYKIKNQSLSKLLSGTIKIEPEEILLGTKKYEIDSKRVVIQRASIIRYRARIDKWKVSFLIHYDDEWLPGGEKILEEVLIAAGKRVGLLDYAPRNNGWYGTFKVSNWKEK